MKGAGAISAIVLGVFGLLAIAAALNGIILSYMWQWFVVPLGVRSIGVAQAIGIALIAAVLTYQDTGSDDEPDEGFNKLLGRLFAKIIAFGIAYGLSFLVPA